MDKHIVILNPAAGLGGAEQSLLDLIRASREARLPLRFTAVLLSEGPLVGKLQASGTEVRILPLPERLARFGDSGKGTLRALFSLLFCLPAIWAYQKQLRRLLSELQADIVHSNGFKTHLLSAICAPKTVPLYWHVRDFVSERRLIPKLLHFFSKVPAKIIANSQATATDCSRFFDPSRIEVLYNGIDTEYFKPQGERWEFAEGTRIGLLASYARWKGQDFFLKAAARIRKRFPNEKLLFVLVGGPIYQTEGSQFQRSELVALAESLGIRECVHFEDFTSDPARIYRGLDIVVHASTRPEPFGRTIAEAMACGRATVAVDNGGSREIIEEGVSALSYPLASESALVEKISQLLEDKGLRAKIAMNARMRILGKFSHKQLAKELARLYGVTSKPEPVRSATG